MKDILLNTPLLTQLVTLLILFSLFAWKIKSYVASKYKPVHFFKAIYFSNYSIVNSSNNESRRFKILQNRISGFILIFLLIEIFMFIFYFNYSVTY